MNSILNFSKIDFDSKSKVIRAASVIDVVLRIRPEKRTETVSLSYTIDSNTLNVKSQVSKRIISAKHDEQQKLINYNFNKIYNQNTTQNKLFNDSIKWRIDHVLHNSENVVIMDYGCTGSGKTFTMLGDKDHPGMLLLSLEYLFDKIATKSAVYCDLDIIPERAEDFIRQNKTRQDLNIGLKRELIFTATNGSRQNSETSLNDKRPQKAVKCAFNVEPENSNITVKPSNQISYYIAMYISMIEIYNENIIDLFNAANVTGHVTQRSTSIFEDKKGNPYVRNITWLPVYSVQEALNIIAAGRKKRHVAATALNHQSSRAHCIINIRLGKVPSDSKTNEPDIFSETGIKSSQLTFIDLAGAEKAAKTGHGPKNADRLVEAGKIHTSLLTLSRVIQILRDNSEIVKTLGKDKEDDKSSSLKLKPVPFRESKLTRLLQTFFTQKSKNLMIVNATLSSEFLEETIHVLKFSSVTQQVSYSKKSVKASSITKISNLENKENLTTLTKSQKFKSSTESLATHSTTRSTRSKKSNFVKPLSVQDNKRRRIDHDKAVAVDNSETEKLKSYIEEYKNFFKQRELCHEEEIIEIREQCEQVADNRIKNLTSYYEDFLLQTKENYAEHVQLNYEKVVQKILEREKRNKKRMSDVMEKCRMQEEEIEKKNILVKKLQNEKESVEKNSKHLQVVNDNLFCKNLNNINLNIEQSTPIVPNQNKNPFNLLTNATPLIDNNQATPTKNPRSKFTDILNPNNAYIELKKHIEEIKSELDSFKTKNYNLETDLLNQKLENKKLCEMIQEEKCNHNEVEEVMTDKIKNLEKRLDAALGDLEVQYNLAEDYETVNRNYDTLVKKYSTSQKLVENLESQKESLSTKARTDKQTITKLKQEILDAEKLQKITNLENIKLKNQIEKIKTEGDLNDKYTTLPLESEINKTKTRAKRVMTLKPKRIMKEDKNVATPPTQGNTFLKNLFGGKKVENEEARSTPMKRRLRTRK